MIIKVLLIFFFLAAVPLRLLLGERIRNNNLKINKTDMDTDFYSLLFPFYLTVTHGSSFGALLTSKFGQLCVEESDQH